MSKIFTTKENLTLKGSYLVNNDKPVFHKEFVKAQKRAEYVVTFANLAKGKDFKGKKADNLEDLREEVLQTLNNKTTNYIQIPEKIKLDLHEQLKTEALAFINYEEKKINSEKINNFLQEFNIIKKFEETGLYFEEDVCELNKIYTIKEIVDAVESIIELL